MATTPASPSGGTPTVVKFNPLVYIIGVPIAIILGGTAIGPLVNISLIAVFVGMVTNQITANQPGTSGTSPTASTTPSQTNQSNTPTPGKGFTVGPGGQIYYQQ